MAGLSCFISLVFLYFSVIDISVIAVIANHCGKENFVIDSGTIHFKGNASSRKSCTYEIKVKQNKRIVLNWKTFSVDGDMPQCSTSSVTVYIG